VVLIALSGPLGWFDPPVADAAELPTLDEVKQKMTERQAQLRSLYLKVRVRGEAPGGLSAVASLGKGSIPNEIQYVAWEGDRRYRRVAHMSEIETTASIRPTVDPEAPPEVQDEQRAEQDAYDRIVLARQRRGLSKKVGTIEKGSGVATAYDGEEVRHLRGTFGLTALPRSEWAPASFSCSYFKSIALYVPDPASSPRAAAPPESMLPKVLDRGKVTTSHEVIDGTECFRVMVDHVVKPPPLVGAAMGMETVHLRATYCLDLEHNLMVRMAEAASDKGVVRSINSEPEEVLPGLWLPMKCRMEEWGESQSPDSEPALVTHLEVLEWSTDVDESLFALEFPPGTRVADCARTEREGWDPARNPIRYVVPADPSLLDEAIEHAVTSMPRRRSWMPLMLYGTVAIVMVLGIVATRRYVGQKKAP